ncbi:hypothetical protein M8494_10200 [Serratia ureilytica]
MIRDLIEKTIPGRRLQRAHSGGFRMPLPPTERQWPTATGKSDVFRVQRAA